MNYCSIVPTRYIGEEDYRCSTWHLLLPHLVENNTEYAKRYKKLYEHKILDNGFFEYGKCPSMEALLNCAEDVGAEYIVIPDGSSREDIENCASVTPEHIKLIGVTVGRTVEEAIACFKMLNEHKNIDMIAIPDRLLFQHLPMNRAAFLQTIRDQFKQWKPLHLFAIDNCYEIEKYRGYNVNSIDSTIAFKCGFRGVFLPVKPEDEPKRPTKEKDGLDYFDIDVLSERQKFCVKRNIKWMRRTTNET